MRYFYLFKRRKNKGQKGVALYLSLMTMTILLAMALGMGVILFAQIGMLRGMGNSAIALAAADTGIERVLVDRTNPSPLNRFSKTLPNGAIYRISVLARGVGGCIASNFCIESVGTYRGVRRAIKVTY